MVWCNVPWLGQSVGSLAQCCDVSVMQKFKPANQLLEALQRHCFMRGRSTLRHRGSRYKSTILHHTLSTIKVSSVLKSAYKTRISAPSVALPCTSQTTVKCMIWAVHKTAPWKPLSMKATSNCQHAQHRSVKCERSSILMVLNTERMSSWNTLQTNRPISINVLT